jgi:phosphoglycolate phosphatase
MTEPATVVFDLDGTLVDSAPAVQTVASRMLAELGAAPLDLAETRAFIGEGAARFVERALAARVLPGDADAHAAALARYLAIYAEPGAEGNAPYPGAEAALDALAAGGVRLGLCTNKPAVPTRNLLDALGWTARFAAVIAGDDLPQRKPDPTPLRETFARAGGRPLLYVGDSEIDEATALAAGAPFALHSAGYRKKPAEAFSAALVFADFADLVAHVLD